MNSFVGKMILVQTLIRLKETMIMVGFFLIGMILSVGMIISVPGIPLEMMILLFSQLIGLDRTTVLIGGLIILVIATTIIMPMKIWIMATINAITSTTRICVIWTVEPIFSFSVTDGAIAPVVFASVFVIATVAVIV